MTPAGRTAYRMCRAGGPVGAADVAEALVEFLAGRPDGAAQAREFGRHWGAGLVTAAGPGRAGVEGTAAPTVEPTVDRVVATLERMGFSPEVNDPAAHAAVDTAAEIRLVTCPLLQAARQHPAVVCGIHHGLVEGLAADQPHRPRHVTLLPFAAPGSCVLTISA